MRLSRILSVFEQLYDPAWAEPWDAVGLVCGDPDQEIRKVMFAVDPVTAVVDEALAWGADLLVTHHPLLLRPVNSVAATTPKGRLIHRMIQSGLALYCAHTNADRADPGVSDALARTVGLTGPLRPMVPAADDPHRGLGRIGTLPEPVTLRDFAGRVASALPATAGAVRVAGPLDETVRTVAVCGGAGDSLLETARAAGVDVYLTADLRHHPASEYREYAAMVAATGSGTDAQAGDGTGAGAGAPALIDAGHWATEWPWLADAERRLLDAVAAETAQVGAGPAAVPGALETRVSTLVTDAWTLSCTVEGAL